jgi:FKBP-type peptidyl-prolyl cis-trans isomerase
MIHQRIIPVLIISLLLFPSCIQENKLPEKEKQGDEKESLIRVNKYLTNKDREVIENYIKRRDWKMKMTRSGLWYEIYEEGEGDKISGGQRVTMYYTVHLLDGTLCYDSGESGPKEFIVGSGNVEIGLDEGIRLLKQGDKARFIIPPHLAYGLIGDENRIPARSVIVYDLEVISNKN